LQSCGRNCAIFSTVVPEITMLGYRKESLNCSHCLAKCIISPSNPAPSNPEYTKEGLPITWTEEDHQFPWEKTPAECNIGHLDPPEAEIPSRLGQNCRKEVPIFFLHRLHPETNQCLRRARDTPHFSTVHIFRTVFLSDQARSAARLFAA
jgi:hypothetical protein